MTDPIADMLTRIRNAHAAHKDTVELPHSNIKESITKTLKDEGYIEDYTLTDKDTVKCIVINLKYVNNSPAITQISRLSKPGRRVYIKSKNITPTLSGHGITILSTSQGIMTDKQARNAKLGGEALCQIW